MEHGSWWWSQSSSGAAVHGVAELATTERLSRLMGHDLCELHQTWSASHFSLSHWSLMSQQEAYSLQNISKPLFLGIVYPGLNSRFCQADYSPLNTGPEEASLFPLATSGDSNCPSPHLSQHQLPSHQSRSCAHSSSNVSLLCKICITQLLPPLRNYVSHFQQFFLGPCSSSQGDNEDMCQS